MSSSRKIPVCDNGCAVSLGSLFLSILVASLILAKFMDTMNLLVLFGIIAMLVGRSQLKDSDASGILKHWGLVVFICFFLVGLFPLLFHGSSLSVWQDQFNERFAPIIAVFFVSLLLIKLNVQARIIWLSLLVIPAAGIIAIAYEYYIVGEKILLSGYRFGGNATSSILLFGVFSALLVSVVIGAAIWSIVQKRYLLLAVYSIGIVVMLLATILTGTRGASVALPVIIIGWLAFSYFTFFKSFDKKVKLLVIVLISVVAFTLTKAVPDRFENRWGWAMKNIQQYYQGSPHSSIGVRLVMYEGVLESVKESFWFGVGSENIEQEIEKQTKLVYWERFALERSGIKGFWDVHNQYLQELFSKGVFSLIGLLVLQLYSLFFFITKSSKDNIFAVTGVIFVISAAMSMMSYSWLRFHDGMFFYFLMVTLLMYGTVMSEKKA